MMEPKQTRKRWDMHLIIFEMIVRFKAVQESSLWGDGPKADLDQGTAQFPDTAFLTSFPKRTTIRE